ncbi:Tritrans,polycis-undecaprenyl-diphosphate synthase (GGDP specific) [uncultured archaeon]|nr:Tritrans,polycis-undecaprenyl-diphosphate synthase (GGDP specific) [uncultured archaeon]
MNEAPKHLGVIVDGNRRFAKRLMMNPWKGHEWGAEKFRKFTEWCFELGVQEITAYVFSIQNFNRPKDEFEYLMKIFKQMVNERLQPDNLKEMKEKGVKITFIGRQEMLPKELQELQNKLMEATKENKPKRVNFAMAYGGREEIIDAVKKIVAEGKEVNEEEFSKCLWLNSNPDLIIRTGGEQRTSNFLPWQSTYSEWIFLEKLWPEIEKEDLVKCIEEYKSRERRFGK